MTADEVIQLTLQLINNPDPIDVANKLQQLKEAVEDAGRSYETLERQTGQYAVAMTEEEEAMDKLVASQVEATNQQKILNQAVEEASGTPGDGEGGGGTGFKGMAGAVLKGEKAISSLASGHGLGRLGSMLEGVLGPLGLPGLGLVLGGLAFAIEPLIPKIKEFCDAWEMGTPKLNEAALAINRLSNAKTPDRKKRAAMHVNSQIMALEDKEDEQGWLAADDARELFRLRGAASAYTHENDEEEAATFAKAQREAAQAKREAAENVEADIDLEMEEGERIGKKEVRIAAAKAKETKQAMTDKAVADAGAAADRIRAGQAAEAKRVAAEADRAGKQRASEARRQAAQEARENTPAKQMERIVSENTYGYNPDQQRHIAHEALNSVSTGAMIGDAVQAAVAEENRKIREDFFRRMKRMQHDSESFYPG